MFSWIPFLTYAVITSATPGPNNIMSMSNAALRGFRGALPFNFGVWAGFSVVMLLCTACCGLLSAHIPKLQPPMLAAGALYMFYLAWQTFHGTSKIESGRPVGDASSFSGGLFLQFVNPKIYIYCIMSMEAYILPAFSGRPIVLFGFAMLLAFVGFAFTLCWSAFGSGLRGLFSRHTKTVNAIMALLLVYCAVSLFL